MHYCLVYYPNCDVDGIEEIRKKYDPTFGVLKPHVTVVFPVPDVVGESNLVDHIDNVLNDRQPFEIRFGGLYKSPDHWLLLELEEGGSKFVGLHRALYTGILAKYLRRDVEFVPHLGLGLFLKSGARYDWDAPREIDFDRAVYDQAVLEASALPLDSKCFVRALELLTIPDEVVFWATGRRASIPKGAQASRCRSFALGQGDSACT